MWGVGDATAVGVGVGLGDASAIFYLRIGLGVAEAGVENSAGSGGALLSSDGVVSALFCV